MPACVLCSGTCSTDQFKTAPVAERPTMKGSADVLLQSHVVWKCVLTLHGLMSLFEDSQKDAPVPACEVQWRRGKRCCGLQR